MAKHSGKPTKSARVTNHPSKGAPSKRSYVIRGSKQADVQNSKVLIEENQLPYIHKNTISKSTKVIKGNNITLFTFFDSEVWPQFSTLDKINLIEEGVTKKTLEDFKTSAQLDYEQLADNLHVARATLINKKRDEKFNLDLSDKIVSLIDIYSYGYEVFGDKNIFNDWIFKPNKALGNKPPFEFLSNSFGRQEVKNLIGRIDYGVYS